jgi:hypothetical protein
MNISPDFVRLVTKLDAIVMPLTEVVNSIEKVDEVHHVSEMQVLIHRK